MTVQLAGNLLTSPADRAAGAAVGEKQGRVIYFPSCAGKRPVQGRFTGFPGGGPPCGNALPNCSATYCGRGNDSLPTGEGVAFHDPTAWRYLVFHDPPAPIGPPCPSEFRTRSSREPSKIWTTVPMRQFVATAARRGHTNLVHLDAGPACEVLLRLLFPIFRYLCNVLHGVSCLFGPFVVQFGKSHCHALIQNIVNRYFGFIAGVHVYAFPLVNY